MINLGGVKLDKHYVVVSIVMLFTLLQMQIVRANNSAEIFTELQLLRSEVANLRQQTELQQQAINQLKNAQMELHQELYKLKNNTNLNAPRVQNNQESMQLANNSALNNKPQNSNQNSNQNTNQNTNQNNNQNIATNNLAQEKNYYDVAFDLVRKKDFAKAKLAWQGFIQRFPQGQYISHANYWLGEVYLAENNLYEALAIFNGFAQNYPDSPKVPDAMYKLGDTHKRLGNLNEAQNTWQRLITQYPTSSATTLAKRELNKN